MHYYKLETTTHTFGPSLAKPAVEKNKNKNKDVINQQQKLSLAVLWRH
jgi:hypothetical protein